MKRLFDIGASLFGLSLVWPLFVVVAVLIKSENRGPIFYRQRRVGRGGKCFSIWKFRTMIPDADRVGGPLTIGDDSRITRVGRWLRKTKVDELPQLLNVLTGQMSFVGPRPEVPDYVQHYTHEQQQVLQLRPGITDPASIKYFDESEILATAEDPQQLYRETIMPDKIQLNLEYARAASLRTDLGVIWNTLRRTTHSVA